MIEPVPEKWQLTREGFDKFLAALDPDREGSGRKYELLRSKLVSYFDWRDCPAPEEHADEALNRVIRKIETGEQIRDPSIYVFGVARMMLLEIARFTERERTALNLFPVREVSDSEPDDTDSEYRVDCLRQCLAALPDKSRELITRYYQGEGSSKISGRKELAAQLGLQLNALRIRACRLRDQLEVCMHRCLVSKGFDSAK